jgi:hypothetical protein
MLEMPGTWSICHRKLQPAQGSGQVDYSWQGLGAGLSKPLGPHPLLLNMELEDLMLVLLDFCLSLLPSLLSRLPLHPFGTGILTCKKVCNFLFNFIGAHS